MFTLMRVAGGAKNAFAIGSMGVTVGQFEDGQRFCRVSKWKTMKGPLERLSKPWTGTTYCMIEEPETRHCNAHQG